MRKFQMFLIFALAVIIRGEPLKSVDTFEPNCSKGPVFWCEDIINAKKCRAVKFCISAVWSTHNPVIDSDSVCDTCKDWVKSARDEINSGNVTDIVKSLDGVCDMLYFDYVKEKCKDLVENNVPEIMSMLNSTMDADTLCSKLWLCNNLEYDKILEIKSSNEQKKPSIGVHQVTVDSAVILNRTPVSEKPNCPFCLMALQEVSNLIKSDKSKANIEKALGKLCSHLNEKLMSQCTEFVKDYTDDVVDALLANFTPQDACTFMKLCTDSTPELVNVKIVKVSAVNTPALELMDNPQCDLCKDLVRVVEQYVINDNTKDEIRENLEKSCSRLKKFADKCKAFVDEYTDRIFALIQKKLEPQEVCHEILFCVTVDDADSQDYDSALEIFDLAMKEPVDEIKEQPQCVICEFVMTKFEDEINDTKTDEEIKHVVRNICSKMPKTISKSCNQFVDYYFDMIIALLKTMKPAMVCQEMKLCTGTKKEIAMIEDEKDVMMVKQVRNDVFTCALCKGFVTSAKTIIDDEKIDLKIEDVEEKFCESISGKYKEKCHALTESYGVAIVKLLQSISESDEVCYKLNLCAMGSVTGMVKLTED